ncbi:hypothetical protein ABEB36_013334 [Hypothenemus hampei]|uniref:Alpha-mannosidase n=1 Tax=Hypothenemus hampei TaxID=57062 RepID=A0ABD1E7T8_HYPHA
MSTQNTLLFLVALFAVVLSFRLELHNDLNSCVQCPEIDPDKINVHLIHHSHDDVGWIKTVDQYYFGLNKSLQNAGVQTIITSVVHALWDNPERKFIQVETAFFWKWWQHQNEDMRTKFKTLVERGQLEIINGGWSMNDEGCVNYQSTIDQFTWGFRILNETLGECGQTTFGWQIDPFGHSREHAAILWKMGFEGLVFSRLDYNDRDLRKEQGNLEFLWQTSANDDDSQLYTAITPDSIYYPPSGFCFDILCADDNIVDDPNDATYNAAQKAQDFSDRMKDYAKWFKQKNVLITMGGDFQYQAADINFENTDKLIKAFENNKEVKLLYSTPSCYLKAVYDSKPELEKKTDDFFPYGNDEHSYWAGYFTSRPNYKRLERQSHHVLQVAKQLNVLAGKTEDVDSITGLREAIGVAQHHDSITGTAKQHVSKDYSKILSNAVQEAENQFNTLLGRLFEVNLTQYTELSSCLLANISICPVSQSADDFLVAVYNPLSHSMNHIVRLPIADNASYTVTGFNGEVETDIISPPWNFSYVKLNDTPSNNELVFSTDALPALGLVAYHVTKNNNTQTSREHDLTATLKFGNNVTGFEIDNTTNLLKSITMNGKTVLVRQEFLHYISHNGSDNSQASGAYIFRPEGEAISFGNPTLVGVYRGNIVEEVHQRYNDWITQVIRLYHGLQDADYVDYIEFDWLVGPLKTSDDKGVEVITRFTIDNFQNNGTFYTDSNGREMIKRRVNYRPTYSYNSSVEPIASNYYPVTSKIVIEDVEQDLRVAVLNDRSQAGSSLEEGQIELMVHRRIFKDDARGVDEPLNETEFEQGVVARGQHYFILGPAIDAKINFSTAAQERILAQRKLLPPWIGVGNVQGVSNDVIENLINKKYVALETPLPINVNLLTLEPWTNSTYLMRLEHFFEKDEDAILSLPVTIDLSTLIANVKIGNLVETTLGGNRRLDTYSSRYDWAYSGSSRKFKSSLNGTEVTLNPMDIKTFIFEFIF